MNQLGIIQSSKPRLILLGGGGHCAACIDVIELENKFDILGIVDQYSSASVCGYPILGDDKVLPSLLEIATHVLITIGQITSPQLRSNLFELTTNIGFSHPTIISPRAHVSKHAQLGNGTIVMHDALVNARAKVGNNVIINSKALIEHDAVIEDHCHISTAAIINGSARVKAGSFVGSNATLIENAVTKQSDFIKAASLFKGHRDE